MTRRVTIGFEANRPASREFSAGERDFVNLRQNELAEEERLPLMLGHPSLTDKDSADGSRFGVHSGDSLRWRAPLVASRASSGVNSRTT